jgi:hypothetical protein
MQNPNVLATRATRKTTRFSVRDTKCNAARRHAPSCMGATEGQRNFAEMRKTLEKPGFYQRRGQEPNFSMFSQCFFGGSNGSFSLRIMPKLSSKFEEVLDLDGFDAVNGRDGFKTES